MHIPFLMEYLGQVSKELNQHVLPLGGKVLLLHNAGTLHIHLHRFHILLVLYLNNIYCFGISIL